MLKIAKNKKRIYQDYNTFLCYYVLNFLFAGGIWNMISGLWNKALQVLKFDSKVNDVIYESVLSTMKEVTYEDGIMILSCVNAYVLDMAKTNLNDSIIGALKTVSGNNISVKYVE